VNQSRFSDELARQALSRHDMGRQLIAEFAVALRDLIDLSRTFVTGFLPVGATAWRGLRRATWDGVGRGVLVESHSDLGSPIGKRTLPRSNAAA
jgi:hypothetical protein